jgi:hypothetical protein
MEQAGILWVLLFIMPGNYHSQHHINYKSYNYYSGGYDNLWRKAFADHYSVSHNYTGYDYYSSQSVCCCCYSWVSTLT